MMAGIFVYVLIKKRPDLADVILDRSYKPQTK